MKEVKEYASAIEYAAANKLGGFRYFYNDCNKNDIINGHFVFEIRRFKYSVSLRVSMIKSFIIGDEEAPSIHLLLTKTNALTVYDVVDGHQEDENAVYDFVVDGIIKTKLQELFDLAEEFYQKACEEKIKAFEKVLLDEENKSSDKSSQSKPKISNVEFYPSDYYWAEQHNEVDTYRADRKVRAAAVELFREIAENNHKDNVFDPEKALEEMYEQIGKARTKAIISSTINWVPDRWDKRYYETVYEWAENRYTSKDLLSNVHPCLMNLLTRQVISDHDDD